MSTTAAAATRSPESASADACWRLTLTCPGRVDSAMAIARQGDGVEIVLVPDGTAARVRVTVRFAVAAAMIAAREARGEAVPADVRAGVMTLESPPLQPGERVQVTLTLAHAVIALWCDGVLVDEDWPVTRRLGTGALAIERPEVVEAVAPAAEAPRADAAALARWLPDERPMGPYWRVAGRNASAGDTMVCAVGDDLHLFWLHDRRWHRSKWGGGGHQFDHAVTNDLRTWRRAPRAIPLTEHGVSVGTGTCVHDGDRFHLFWHNHGARFACPDGVRVATSTDGGRFAAVPDYERTDLVQPGVWREADGWYLLSGTALHRSDDLRSWTSVDPRWIAPPAGVTDECPSVFAVGDRFWLLTGREGAWTWRHGEKPQPAHDRAPYDGLMVPMVARWRDRLILSGWIADDARTVGMPWTWGGTLMWRELIPDGDGFRCRWLPELVPDGGAWCGALPSTAVPAGSSASFALPEGPVHLRLDVQADDELSLVLGGGDDGRDGTEIRIEPDARRLCTGRAPDGAFSSRPAHPHHWAHDFALPPRSGLERTRRIDVILWPDRGGVIVDVQLDSGHTIAARHIGAWRGGAVVAARGGAARVSASVRTLER